MEKLPFEMGKVLFVEATVTLMDAPEGMIAVPVMLVAVGLTSTPSWTPAFTGEPPMAKNAKLFSLRTKVAGPV